MELKQPQDGSAVNGHTHTSILDLPDDPLILSQPQSRTVSSRAEDGDSQTQASFFGVGTAGRLSVSDTHSSLVTARLWIGLDLLTILVSALAAGALTHPTELHGLVHDWLHHMPMAQDSVRLFLLLLSGYALALVILSRQYNLYTLTREIGFLHEQRQSMQACMLAGLVLAGSVYLLHDIDIPRAAFLLTVVLVSVLVGLRRLLIRLWMWNRFRHGIGLRKVLVVGPPDTVHNLRRHLRRHRDMGYLIQDSIDFPLLDTNDPDFEVVLEERVRMVLEHARRKFVDEIFFTQSRTPAFMQRMMEKAHIYGVELRLVFASGDGIAWHRPIEHIGLFPSVRLHCGHVPLAGLLVKRVIDILFSSLVLTLFSPLFAFLAILIKLDSHGPVFYASERIGKKGRIFRCLKFRTMVMDAEARLAALQKHNERGGILFKMSSDPRITRVGSFLRKYSLDELPQFFNVLRGEMSVVGPRPPIAREVKQYELEHLRRLDVLPGITGLWQVQGREDPSFDNYVALDITYIDNWSLLLDVKIILRTIGVVFAGTGS